MLAWNADLGVVPVVSDGLLEFCSCVTLLKELIRKLVLGVDPGFYLWALRVFHVPVGVEDLDFAAIGRNVFGEVLAPGSQGSRIFDLAHIKEVRRGLSALHRELLQLSAIASN